MLQLELRISVWLIITLRAFAQDVDPDNDPNCAECQPVHRLLERCNLPSLLTPNEIFSSTPVHRNVTQASPFPVPFGLTSTFETGPSTRVLTNSSQANCLCEEGRKSFWECSGCTNYLAEGKPFENSSRMALDYSQECEAWGYFELDTGGWPSTTVTSLPTATAPAQDLVPSCAAECNLISNQIRQCRLNNTLATNPAPNYKYIPLDRGSVGEQLYNVRNRTEAQCFCTLPVMRTLLACRACAYDKRGDYLLMGNHYQSDCNEMGYYSDSEMVIPEPKVTATPTTAVGGGASPTSAATSLRKNGERIEMILGTMLVMGGLVMFS